MSATDPVAEDRTADGHRRAHVPWGLDLAAAWSWRLIVIGFAVYMLLGVLAFFAVITLPLVVALLITSLSVPVVRVLKDIGIPRGLAAGLVVVGGLVVVVSLLTFVGQQVANGANDLATSVADGLGQIKDWLKTGPLHATDSQINDYIDRAQTSITDRAQNGEVVGTGKLYMKGQDDPGEHVFYLQGAHDGKRGLAWHGVSHHPDPSHPSVSEEMVINRLTADHQFVGLMQRHMHPGMVMIVTSLPTSPNTRSAKDFVVMTTG